jgi:hypothetical protein
VGAHREVEEGGKGGCGCWLAVGVSWRSGLGAEGVKQGAPGRGFLLGAVKGRRSLHRGRGRGCPPGLERGSHLMVKLECCNRVTQGLLLAGCMLCMLQGLPSSPLNSAAGPQLRSPYAEAGQTHLPPSG